MSKTQSSERKVTSVNFYVPKSSLASLLMFANTNLFRIFKANIFTSHVKSQNKSIFDVKRIAMSLTMNLGVFHEKKKKRKYASNSFRPSVTQQMVGRVYFTLDL